MATKRFWILCGLITVLCSTTYSQSDSLRCFNVEQQKQILKKFVLLDQCQDLRKIDSLEIFNLRALNVEAGKKIHILEKKALRRKKLALFGIPTGILSGFIFGILKK